MDKWRVEVERVPMQRAFRLWLTYHDGEHRRVLVAAHEILDIEPGQIIDQATAVIPEGAAQQLIDELWRAGLRPSEGTGSAGALAATQKHLEDMRRLVFDAPVPISEATPNDGEMYCGELRTAGYGGDHVGK